jgi:hypothetical protein
VKHPRRVLPACWFDAASAATGIACLNKYRKAWDDRLDAWRDAPQAEKHFDERGIELMNAAASAGPKP